jgi:hypothetical protein
VVAPAPGELVRFGLLGERLSPDYLVAIEEVASPQGKPWAVQAWQVLVSDPQTLRGGDVWYLNVLLEPTVATSRLGRGRVVRLRCWPLPEHASCLYWRQTGASSYGQVADQEERPAGVVHAVVANRTLPAGPGHALEAAPAAAAGTRGSALTALSRYSHRLERAGSGRVPT